MSATWRRVVRWSVRLTVYPILVLMVLAGLFLVGGPGYYSAKYAPVATLTGPTPRAGPVVAERQTEAHTCGLHAVRAVYRAYGIDPGRANLRFRLGTDVPGVNVDEATAGTIQPDMLRVLRQDGFETELVLRPSGEHGRIRAHLRTGHPALAMVRAPGLHWVVLDRIEGGEVVIADSLVDEAYREPAGSYIDERVLSGILVRPR